MPRLSSLGRRPASRRPPQSLGFDPRNPGGRPAWGSRRRGADHEPMTTTLTRTSGNLAAGDLAAATPKTRDRYVDFLRVASLMVVMLGHWLMAVVIWADGRLQTSNVLEVTPAARRLT